MPTPEGRRIAFTATFGVSFSAEELASGAVPYNYTEQAFPSREAPGLSAFYRDGRGDVFHTYSTYGVLCQNSADAKQLENPELDRSASAATRTDSGTPVDELPSGSRCRSRFSSWCSFWSDGSAANSKTSSSI